MNLKQLLLHILISSALLIQTSCNDHTTAMDILSPATNSRIAVGSTVIVKWQNNKTPTTLFNISLHSNLRQALLLASNVNSMTESVSVQLPTAVDQGGNDDEYYIIKFVDKQNMKLASSGPLYLMGKDEMAYSTAAVAQRQYAAGTNNDSSLLLPRQFPPSAAFVSDGALTLSSVQVAVIAMSIVACCSLFLSAYLLSKHLLDKRRERMLDNEEQDEEEEERLYRQQCVTNDYATLTIHDTQLDDLAGSLQHQRHRAWFFHKELPPVPPTYKSN